MKKTARSGGRAKDCDQLDTQITQNLTRAEQLMQAVLKEAFNHNAETETTSPTPEAARA